MPELPEAETIVRGLRRTLPGRRIREVAVLHADVLPQGPDPFRSRTKDRRIVDVHRRGKNIVLDLQRDGVVLVNLGMTGKLLPDPPREGPSAPTHPALRFELDDGGVLVYDDVRRFGRVEVLDADGWRERSGALGPEPLDPGFEAGDLAEGLARSRAPVRSWLLDQNRIAGVGNIYANEALFGARLHPRRPARSLDAAEARALHASLRRVLRSAIGAGGTTFRDYRDATGEEGRYSSQLRVYDREGEACTRCGTSVVRIVFGGRSAFLCPDCQRPGHDPHEQETR